MIAIHVVDLLLVKCAQFLLIFRLGLVGGLNARGDTYLGNGAKNVRHVDRPVGGNADGDGN